MFFPPGREQMAALKTLAEIFSRATPTAQNGKLSQMGKQTDNQVLTIRHQSQQLLNSKNLTERYTQSRLYPTHIPQKPAPAVPRVTPTPVVSRVPPVRCSPRLTRS